MDWEISGMKMAEGLTEKYTELAGPFKLTPS